MQHEKFPVKLDVIADKYFNAEVRDLFIENVCQEYEVDWILKYVSEKSFVIDLGYGDGIIAPKLAKECELTILEGSSKLHRKAREELGRSAKVIHTLFEDFVPESPVDVVVACHVLEHVDNPKLLLKQIAQWIKPNGYLLVVVPNRESIHRQLALRMKLITKLDELSPRDHLVGHQRVYALDDLTDDLVSSGFKVLDHRGFFLKPLANAQMLDWPLDLIRALNELSEDIPSEFCANLGIVCSLK